jgi:hypothetical protein
MNHRMKPNDAFMAYLEVEDKIEETRSYIRELLIQKEYLRKSIEAYLRSQEEEEEVNNVTANPRGAGTEPEGCV